MFYQKKIEISGGCCLFVDYGENYRIVKSLRGIKNHEFVSILDDVGNFDLSALVNFSSIRNAIGKNQNLVQSKVITQRDFLFSLGIIPRLIKLLANAKDEKIAKDLTSAYSRLVGKTEMGKTYKAYSFAAKKKVLKILTIYLLDSLHCNNFKMAYFYSCRLSSAF